MTWLEEVLRSNYDAAKLNDLSTGDSYITHKKMGRLNLSTSSAIFETSREEEIGRDLCSIILLDIFMVFSEMVVALARLDLLA